MYLIRPWLYVGKYHETRDRRLLTLHRIGAMLQLAGSVEHEGITSLYLPIEDGEPLARDLLRQGVDFVREGKRRGHTVLIACGVGISRSVTFAVAALKEEEEVGLLDALRTVRRRHRNAMPHPALWRSLCAYYREDIPFDVLLDQEGID